MTSNDLNKYFKFKIKQRVRLKADTTHTPMGFMICNRRIVDDIDGSIIILYDLLRSDATFFTGMAEQHLLSYKK